MVQCVSNRYKDLFLQKKYFGARCIQSLVMCTTGIHCRVLNHQYPQFMLDQYLIDSPSTPQLTLDQHSIKISVKGLPNTQPTINPVGQVSIDCQPSIDKALIEMSIEFINLEY